MRETVLGLTILVFVLIGVVTRPRIWRWREHGLPVSIPAGLGAIAALAADLVTIPALGIIASRVWDSRRALYALCIPGDQSFF